MDYLQSLLQRQNVSSFEELSYDAKKAFCYAYMRQKDSLQNETFHFKINCTGIEIEGHKVHPYWRDTHPIILWAFILLLCLTGVLMNTFFIIVVARNKKLQTALNILVVNLSAAGILLQTFTIPVPMSASIETKWSKERWLCVLMPYIYLVCDFVICYSVVYICLILALRLFSPRNAVKIEQGRTAVAACGAIWVGCFLANAWYASGQKYVNEDGYQYCYNVNFTASVASYYGMILLWLICIWLVPLCIMGTVIGIAIYKLYNKSSSLYQRLGPEDCGDKRRDLFMALALLVVFIGLRLPYKAIVIQISLFKYFTFTHSVLFEVFLGFQLTSPTLCAFVFLYFIPDLRPGFVQSLCSRIQRRVTSSNNTNLSGMHETPTTG